MFLTIVGVVVVIWFGMMGRKFYRGIDWSEPPDPSPDLRAMHKEEAQLLHIQDLLLEARRQEKISAAALEEVNRYCESEIKAMRGIETAWKNRYKSK